MIFDTLPNFHNYLPINRLFPLASEFIHGHDLLSLDIGKHPIGQGLTVIIDEYATRQPNDRYLESHRAFIDFQIVLTGIETIGICPTSRCQTVTPYNQEKDFEMVSGMMDFITLNENFFAIFFPHDAHLPGTTVNSISAKVRKMVIKVPVRP